MHPQRLSSAALLALVTLGTPIWIALSAPRWTTHAHATPPATLAETGLYADARSLALADGLLEYAPQYPLWTDGARKRRWIALPPGSVIDASDADAWRFPVGTKLWKEFAFERRIETRYMELGRDGRWSYATYAWQPDESSATLAPEGGVAAACESSRGALHDIPGRFDCLACHEASPSPVLGFSALQLSSERDPRAPHADARESGVTLDELVARGLVRNLAAELLDSAPRITARSAVERAALGYLHGNCGGCHNSRGALAELGLDLAWSFEHGSRTLATTLDTPARLQGNGLARQRLVAGAPGESLLFQRLATREPYLQMPALGTHLVDVQARELIAQWIAELGRRERNSLAHGAAGTRR